MNTLIRRGSHFVLQGAGPSLILLLLLGGGFTYFAPEFIGAGNLINVLRQASPLFIAAAGQMLVILVAGIDISTGAVVAFASVCAALATVHGNLGIGIAAGIVLGAMAGAVSGVAVAIFRVQPVIATIGMLSIARGLAFLLSGGTPIEGLPAGFQLIGNGAVLAVPVPVIIAACVLAALAGWLGVMPSGRYLFAIGGSEDAARAAGIRVRYWRALAYAAAGALAGLAALIYTARSASGQSTFGYGLELQTIGAVVLGGTALGGGRASVLGTALGALIIVVLANGMDLTGVSPYVQNVVLGIAIVVIVFLDQSRRRWSRRASSRKQSTTNLPSTRFH